MLSGHDVSLKWRELFHTSNIDSETIVEADALLAELSPENPLWHRLTTELDEICELKGIRRLHNRAS